MKIEPRTVTRSDLREARELRDSVKLFRELDNEPGPMDTVKTVAAAAVGVGLAGLLVAASVPLAVAALPALAAVPVAWCMATGAERRSTRAVAEKIVQHREEMNELKGLIDPHRRQAQGLMVERIAAVGQLAPKAPPALREQIEAHQERRDSLFHRFNLAQADLKALEAYLPEEVGVLRQQDPALQQRLTTASRYNELNNLALSEQPEFYALRSLTQSTGHYQPYLLYAPPQLSLAASEGPLPELQVEGRRVQLGSLRVEVPPATT